MPKIFFKNYWRLLTLNIHWCIKGGGGAKGALSIPYKIDKGVVNLRSQTNKV